MTRKASNDKDVKPAADEKMGANANTPILLYSVRPQRRRRNDARLCLLGMSHSGVIFVLLILLSL